MEALYQPKTSVQVEWGSYDPDAKAQAKFVVDRTSAPYTATFVNPALSEFKKEFLHVSKYATLERDYWYGDGTFVLMPDPPAYDARPKGFWSNHVSDDNNRFKDNLSINILFDNPRDLLGLTLRFDQEPGVYAGKVQIYWILEDGHDGTTHYPDSNIYFCKHMITNCRGIQLVICESANPGRFAKLIGIDFGEEHRIDTDLISCNVLEEVQPISAELPFNTLDFSFIDYDLDIRDYNLINLAFRERQPVRVSGMIDGVPADMGLFYVTTWENGSDGVHVMQAKSILGVMADVNYDAGVYFNQNVGILISQIFNKLDPYNTRYVLDNSLANEYISGWLPVLPMRETLQQILFAIGGVADESRGDVVNIKPWDYVYMGDIQWDNRSLEQELRQADVVTGVDLYSHKFTENDDATETVLIDDDFDVGVHRVDFSAPMYGRVIDFDRPENKVLEGSENYVVFEIKRAGYVFMTGFPYLDTVQKHQHGLMENMQLYGQRMLTVDGAFLVTPSRAAITAIRTYDYYKKRYDNTYKMRMLPAHKVGQRWLVHQGEYQGKGKALDGVITQMEIDCTGGFMANVTMRGGLIVPSNI